MIADEVVAKGACADPRGRSTTNPDEITGVERDFVEQVVMGVGRPVIVLPHQGEAKLSLNDVVVGWDGGREAAALDLRCAAAAPKVAKKVRVVRVDPQKDPSLRAACRGPTRRNSGASWRQGGNPGLSDGWSR